VPFLSVRLQAGLSTSSGIVHVALKVLLAFIARSHSIGGIGLIEHYGWFSTTTHPEIGVEKALGSSSRPHPLRFLAEAMAITFAGTGGNRNRISYFWASALYR